MKYFLLWLFLAITLHPSYGQSSDSALFNSVTFNRAVAENIRFPPSAQRLGKSIRVYVSFTLTDKGTYQDVAVINHEPIHESLKQEIDRLWRTIPNQDPSCAGNYVVPISFMLGEGGPDRLKPIFNQKDKFMKQDSYTLLKEVLVTGYLACELRSLSSQ